MNASKDRLNYLILVMYLTHCYFVKMAHVIFNIMLQLIIIGHPFLIGLLLFDRQIIHLLSVKNTCNYLFRKMNTIL